MEVLVYTQISSLVTFSVGWSFTTQTHEWRLGSIDWSFDFQMCEEEYNSIGSRDLEY